MRTRVYLSNISPYWPFSRQEAALASVVPGWGSGHVRVYRDTLSARQRKAHNTETLAERALILRPTHRKDGDEVIYVASLAVMAWTAEDMLECLTQAIARGASVHVVDADLRIPPDATATILHMAAREFAAGRRRRAAGEAGLTGGQISGRRRSEAAQAAAKSIEAEWRLPSSEYPTAELLKRAGVSRNTVKQYLGARTEAQRRHIAAQKRRQSAFGHRGMYRP